MKEKLKSDRQLLREQHKKAKAIKKLEQKRSMVSIIESSPPAMISSCFTYHLISSCFYYDHQI